MLQSNYARRFIVIPVDKPAKFQAFTDIVTLAILQFLVQVISLHTKYQLPVIRILES